MNSGKLSFTPTPSVHGRHVWIDEAGGCNWCFIVARDVFAVVRDSRMWCPRDIGRDSWVWGEQETLYTMHSPHEVGEEPLAEMIPWSGENGVALG